MKKICILSHNQFGYHIDSFNYCKYLKDKYEIHYICFDLGRKKIKLDDINVKYIEIKNIEIINRINYIKHSLLYIKKENIESILNIQIPFSFIYKFFLKKKKMIYDVRSLSVSSSRLRNRVVNTMIKFDSSFFKIKTVIDYEVAKQLNWNEKNFTLLKLGADKKIKKIQHIKNVNFLYVGTLSNRNLNITIESFNKLLKENENVTYTIIGSGTLKEEEMLKSLIQKSIKPEAIKFLGYINNDDMEPYFENNNVGISYIPQVEYYDKQPPTKTYEYLANGLVCLATNTFGNRNIINKNNGILVEDDLNSIYLGMKYIVQNISLYDRENIMKSMEKHSWEYITKKSLLNLF